MSSSVKVEGGATVGLHEFILSKLKEQSWQNCYCVMASADHDWYSLFGAWYHRCQKCSAVSVTSKYCNGESHMHALPLVSGMSNGGVGVPHSSDRWESQKWNGNAILTLLLINLLNFFTFLLAWKS